MFLILDLSSAKISLIFSVRRTLAVRMEKLHCNITFPAVKEGFGTPVSCPLYCFGPDEEYSLVLFSAQKLKP